jgi:photosystem II stability/assembly factor-like uncharacterized protein
MKKNLILLLPLFVLLSSCEELGLSRKTRIDGLNLEFHTYGLSLRDDIGPIFFTSEETGYFTVTTGVCKTDDGGKTWRRLDLQTEDLVTDVYFLNDSEGFITSRGKRCDQYSPAGCTPREAKIFHTMDGGETWSQISVPSSFLSSVYFNTENSGFAVGDKTFSTVDGGVSWKEITVPGNVTGYSQVEFVTEKNGLMCRRDGQFARTTDGGQTWEAATPVPGVSYSPRAHMSVVTEDLIYFSTGFQIYKSTDWANSWVKLPKPPPYHIYGLVGVPEGVLFIVGEGESAGGDSYHAMMFYSTDGGQSWRGESKVREVRTLWGAHFLRLMWVMPMAAHRL